MENTTYKDLIEMMHSKPKNDFEIGFNAALTILLKIELTPHFQPENKLTVFDKVIIGFTNSNEEHTKFSTYQKNEIIGYIVDVNNSNKLMAIKLLKEVTGMGLKECKYIADELYLQYGKEKTL